MPHTPGRATQPQTLLRCLRAVLLGNARRSDVQHLVDIARRMAMAYLHTKARMGTLDPSRFGMTFEDMATDAIADLFARDDDGRFIELHGYFASTDEQRRAAGLDLKLGDADAEIALRRLVFGKVNERLFRSYKENDPNLGKVIRNIKDAAAAAGNCRLERVGGRQWIIFGDDLAGERPVAPADIVEAYVTSALGRLGQTSEAIDALEHFLDYHPYYRNGYPVSALAKIVRSGFIRLGAAMSDDAVQTSDDTFTDGEVRDAIQTAIASVRAKTFATYVATSKVDPDTFEVYMQTVSDVLASEFIHGTSSQNSHFDLMATHLPALSKADYRRRHRNRVEYMVKLARTNMSELFAQDFAH